MDCWWIEEEGLLVRLEGERGCGTAPEEDRFVLLDGTGEVERVWEPQAGADDEGASLSVHYEVEDGVFCRIVEERFADGRTNYDREIELEDLEDFDPRDGDHPALPDEESLRAAVRRHDKI